MEFTAGTVSDWPGIFALKCRRREVQTTQKGMEQLSQPQIFLVFSIAGIKQYSFVDTFFYHGDQCKP
jgi:hypothetical protein